MILFLKDGCEFCDKVKAVPGLAVVKVKSTPDGIKLYVEEHEIPVPLDLPGFPALIDGKDVYVGLSLIEERLKSLGALK